MASLADAEKYSQQKNLKGFALHGSGQPPQEYGIMYIPHKVLIDGEGKVVKNFDVKLPEDLDALLEGTSTKPASDGEGAEKEEKS
mmetsp:Transcript_47285/g.134904  ORF Transcript_47285/g.134904 Transcript_47285/m.134904 type:complete len:85 (-) Transcript_47285:169-423(-)